MTNLQYRSKLLTAIYMMKNQKQLDSINQIRVKTTILYMKVKINGYKMKVIPNSSTTISIIREKRAKKFRLEI